MESDATDNDSTKASTPTCCRINDSIITPKLQQISCLSSTASPGFRKHRSTSHYTKAVSRPFKSPFKSPLSSLSSLITKSVTSPNIQALERRLQLLKRAVKIKADEEEGKLEELITKWRSVGREVSWEVWSVVREQGQENSWRMGSSKQWSGLGGPERSWGWDNTTGHKKETDFESNWGNATTDGDGTGDEEDLVGSRASTCKTADKPAQLHLDLDSKGNSGICSERC